MRRLARQIKRAIRGKIWWPSYRRYLKSDKWKALRERKLRQVGYKCEECPNTTYLQAHHLTYERVGNERLSDLKILCKWCHRRKHRRRRK